MDKVAVLIPCYNEEKTIGKVVKDWKKELPDAMVYVYDNNSTDGSDEIARDASAIVCYEYRQGKGNVVRSMFRNIDADCYIMVDADDTYCADDARKHERCCSSKCLADFVRGIVKTIWEKSVDFSGRVRYADAGSLSSWILG